jgi:hypothetical protein
MTRRQGSGRASGAHEEGPPAEPASGRAPAAGAGVPPGLPDVVRRVIALGLSGVFATQETIRQAVGDALPREWVDFAADQTERTRAEFLERLAGELARTIESIDLAKVVQQALEGRTLEVTARIRMLPDTKQGTRIELSMVEDEEG